MEFHHIYYYDHKYADYQSYFESVMIFDGNSFNYYSVDEFIYKLADGKFEYAAMTMIHEKLSKPFYVVCSISDLKYMLHHIIRKILEANYFNMFEVGSLRLCFSQMGIILNPNRGYYGNAFADLMNQLQILKYIIHNYIDSNNYDETTQKLDKLACRLYDNICDDIDSEIGNQINIKKYLGNFLV